MVQQKGLSALRGAQSPWFIGLFVLFFLMIALGISLFFYQRTFLVKFVIEDAKTKNIVFSKTMKIGESFKLNYIHSVTNQPVEEVFYVKDANTLAMKEMRYDSFGANLPVGPEKLAEETTSFISEEGYYRVVYENRVFDAIPLRVGQVIANHQLFFSDGSRLSFQDIVPGGTYVKMRVQPYQ
ncbi:DUF1850 domain-containing protein [Microaerobacter geothermalis]|uniref:DUF1850 domain-containing protein n=1 Tax=Microaerobacter geothermalis TaxID=674972 RepID=UPI001F29A88B|nr:DUF1850 domain-containing protein [Microaerobacter geothermalis]MCF6094138.1 DUF1850 domain-containing protein [Microaerobacter geothermalis]